MIDNAGWGTNVNEIKELKSHPHHKEIVKYQFVSGVLQAELAIVEDDAHFVPEWQGIYLHLNVRTNCHYCIDGYRIPKQPFPLPTELTKKHYKPNEMDLIKSELFSKLNQPSCDP